MISDAECKCPKCGNDMKEYVTRYRCRNPGCFFSVMKCYPHTGKCRETLSYPDVTVSGGTEKE